MAKFELKLPKMGESVAEATITNWVKNVGDTVEQDETIVFFFRTIDRIIIGNRAVN